MTSDYYGINALIPAEELQAFRQETEAQEASVAEVYGILMAGKKLRFPFPTVNDAKLFLTRLSNYKSRQQALALSIAMITPEEKQVLKTSTSDVQEDGSIFLTLHMETLVQSQKYTFTFVEE